MLQNAFDSPALPELTVSVPKACSGRATRKENKIRNWVEGTGDGMKITE